MKRYIPLFLFLITFEYSAKAQGRADYRRNFTEGSFLILENNYSQALKSFLEAYQIDSSSANINYKIGFCYLKNISDKNKSLPYLERAVLNTSKKYNDIEPQEKSAPINAYYYYGQALHFNYKFDEAIANYEKFKSFLSQRQSDLLKDVNRQIEISTNAKLIVGAPVNVIIKNLGDNINTSYPDYSPKFTADEKTLIFTSRRPGSTGGDKTPEGEFYEDIYISSKKNDGIWGIPVSISPNVNSFTNETSDGLSADGKTLLIYKEANGGDIYYSELKGNEWSAPESIGTAVNTPSYEGSACISPDGNTLYFVSDRKGGLGGKDIWKCTKLPNGSWSYAANLGAPVNTPYDEESPFIHANGNILFFSSQGHQSIGGFDIFFSTKEDTGWDEPLNIGYPINTTDDDLNYVTSTDGKRAYYSSTCRPEGFGDKDIYQISTPEKKEQPVVLIKGLIIPAKGDQLPTNIEIVAINSESGIVSSINPPFITDGNFTILISPNSNYNLSYQSDGKEFYNEIINVPADSAYKEISKVIHLKHFAPEKALEVENSHEITEKKDTIIKTSIVAVKEKQINENESKIIAKEENKYVKEHEQLAKVDGLSFQMFFKYNVTETDVADVPFKKFIDNLKELYTKNGSIKIDLLSSASLVPTRAYKTNNELALARAEKAKEQILEALKNKGVDSSKIKFSKIKSTISGPKYNSDYLINKAAYEKFQFVKVDAY